MIKTSKQVNWDIVFQRLQQNMENISDKDKATAMIKIWKK